jgi:AcrR family transcriptional regulator
MIDEMGFDAFTFRKLAIEIESTEASVYRYFESKHKLLLYLISLYWGYLEYRLVFALVNVKSPHDRLEKAIRIITGLPPKEVRSTEISETRLNRIVISEGSKTYLTKEVDQENREGLFLVYKQLVSRISDIILEINPRYKYPRILVSTVIEGARLQRYFAGHLPRLTDTIKGKDAICEFYHDMIFKAIGKKNTK